MSDTIQRPHAAASALVLATLVAITGCAAGNNSIQPDFVQRTLHTQADAWNRGDIDAFMQPYWNSDDLTFSSGGNTIHGWQATLERYKTHYPDRAAMGTLKFDIDRVQPLGPLAALVLGRWHLERAEPIGGNFSLIFQRIKGEWRIIHDHTSVLEE